MLPSQICGIEQPKYWIFDFTTAPSLLFYSYLPILLVSLIFSILILTRQKKSIQNKLFFYISLFFSFWVLNILVQWISSYHVGLMFAWQLTALFEMPIFLLSIYFVEVFAKQKDIAFWKKIVLSALFVGTILCIPTKLNISSYDYENCVGVLGRLWYFIYGFELISLVWIAIIGLKHYKDKNLEEEHRKKVTILTLGMVLFLGIFAVSNIYGEITQDYEINLVGPIGMALFLGLVTYLIVKYKSFNMKLIGSQALVYAMWILVFALIFIEKIEIIHTIVLVTFFILIGVGVTLVKSVKNEVKQREHLAELTDRLADANVRLQDVDKLKTEFLSLASHQLRSPLTAIKGYTSMLLEGSFGAITKEQNEAIDRVFQSSKHLAVVVEDLLNVSKIEQGGMQYIMGPFDIRKSAYDLAMDLKVTAEKKGLKLTFSSDTDQPHTVYGDVEKIRQVLLNFIDNSVKYTKEGSVEVSVNTIAKDGKNVVRFAVKDTGMGISPETKEKLFQKFSRGEGGKINTGGSGLGLYLAKEIVSAHKGVVDVESEGLGKGSTFLLDMIEYHDGDPIPVPPPRSKDSHLN